jgi:energy-coupling factor transport system permease protein
VRPTLAYAPGRSPLHRASPAASIALLGSLAAVAFVFSSPLVLASVGAAAAIAGIAAGARRAVAASLKLALPLLVLMTAINALVSHRGETVLLRGWELPVLGNTDATLESLAAGGAIGLRVLAVIIPFAVYSACVDPDRVLRALRPLARHSALSAALVSRLVPLAAADLSRLREAAALRGPGAEPVGRAALARRLVEGSLDRAIDVAATLELRGHSLPTRPRLRREPSRDTPPLLVTAALIVAAALAASLGGACSFETYPEIELATDPATLALCAALPVLALLPFAIRRFEQSGSGLAIRHRDAVTQELTPEGASGG